MLCFLDENVLIVHNVFLGVVIFNILYPLKFCDIRKLFAVLKW